MKMNDFAGAVKNKPNQTQLQTNHPIFKISLKNPLICEIFGYFRTSDFDLMQHFNNCFCGFFAGLFLSQRLNQVNQFSANLS